MKINEIFKGIQGEGRFVGHKMLFIRTSGCTRKCSFCDTSYHVKGRKMSVSEIIKQIKKSKCKIVCFTGGEPLLWRNELTEIIDRIGISDISFHLETNGDLLTLEMFSYFHYISLSPKSESLIPKIKHFSRVVPIIRDFDVKVVYDGKNLNKRLLQVATLIMPLTTYNKKKDLEIMRKCWNYCLDNDKVFCPRLQYIVFGKKKGI